jgi:hypothetical protein
MSKVKTGDILSCEVCGLSVIVDEDCGCAITEIICCEEPMANRGQIPPKNKPATATPKKKVATKKANPTAKKKIAKKPAKKIVKKPAAKKKVAKKSRG